MLLTQRAMYSDFWGKAWLKYFLSQLQLILSLDACFLFIFCIRWFDSSSLLFSKKSCSFSLFLESFFLFQRDFWLLSVILFIILHWLTFFLGNIVEFLRNWNLLLNLSWLNNWLESIDFDWIGVLNQNYLLVISWDYLSVWKNLRVVIHQ